MKHLLLLFFIGFSYSVFAQTPKMKHKRLTAQLNLEEKRSDSLYEIHDQLMTETSDIRSNMMNRTIVQLEKKEKEINAKKLTITQSIDHLKLLGYNPDSIITKEQLSKFPLRSFREAKEFYMPLDIEEYEFENVSDRFFETGRNTKEDNELLTERIAAYKVEYPLNIQRTKNLEDYLVKLKEYEKQLDTTKEEYEIMGQVVSHLYWQLQSKLDSLKNNYRKSGPKGFPAAYAKVFPHAFDPPEIVKTMDQGEFEDKPKQVEVDAQKVEPVVYQVVEEQADFIGGMRALKQYLAKNMRFPEIAQELGISGKAYVKFVVTSTGEISKVQLIKGIADCPECGEEAVRLVKAMPLWKPAMNKGKAVDSWFTLPINFVVQ